MPISRASVRPRLLDLFCGAGGAAMGYHRAGFDVVGVDIKPQPSYPFVFQQGDALEFLEAFIGGHLRGEPIAAFHASPPCQGYSIMANTGSGADTPRLVGRVRELLRLVGLPYVIENVPGAPLESPVMICGASLGLGVAGADLHRHRLFECSFPAFGLACSRQSLHTVGVYGGGSQRERAGGRLISQADKRLAMGIDWMTRDEMNEAIPPAMTEHIGGFLMVEINARKAAA